MTMKLNGKTYPVSCLKMYMDDNILKMLKTLTAVYQQQDNRHTLAMLISHTYLALVQEGKIADEDKLKEVIEKAFKGQDAEAGVPEGNNSTGTTST